MAKATGRVLRGKEICAIILHQKDPLIERELDRSIKLKSGGYRVNWYVNGKKCLAATMESWAKKEGDLKLVKFQDPRPEYSVLTGLLQSYHWTPRV